MSLVSSIKSDFAKVVQCSQEFYPSLENIDKLFDKWLDAKRDIIECWGGKYIYEVPEPVQFELSKEEKKRRLNEFLDVISMIYGNEDLVEFLEFAQEDFFSNHLSQDYFLDGVKKINKGTKIIRAFKYFEHDKKVLTELQNQASMIIQEDKVNGILCFSVHPMDFLSLSENTYHWRSCHALDGDYRAGNLTYMVDKSTVICYLRNGSEYAALPNFPSDILWNSKKWRMLLFLSNDWSAMFAGRQYPFHSPTALDLVSAHFLKSIGKSPLTWSPWYDDYIDEFPRKNPQKSYHTDLFSRHIAIRSSLYSMRDLVEDVKGSKHFNDLLNSSYYIPYYCWEDSYWARRKNKKTHFCLGGEVDCLCCGRKPLDATNLLRCEQCELDLGEGENEYYAYCGCCERRSVRDNMVWVNGLEDYVCESCANLETRDCEECGETWYTCDIIYDRDTEQYLCPNCLKYRI